MKPKKNDKSKGMRAAITFLFDTVIYALAIMAIYLLFFSNDNDKLHEFDLIKNLGTTYYDGQGNIFIRFEADDPNQRKLVSSIENVCYKYNMTNCMNQKMRFGLG